MSADNIFKFVSVRPVQKADPARVKLKFPVYDKSKKSPLHKLLELLEGTDAREKAVEIAVRYLESDNYTAASPEIVDAVMSLPRFCGQGIKRNPALDSKPAHTLLG